MKGRLFAAEHHRICYFGLHQLDRIIALFYFHNLSDKNKKYQIHKQIIYLVFKD